MECDALSCWLGKRVAFQKSQMAVPGSKIEMKSFARLLNLYQVWVYMLLLGGLTACDRPASNGWQGYVEGDFVSVASPIGGRLDHLRVVKGDRVETNTELFVLEREAELAAKKEALERLRQAQARLEDLKKGLRPTEIAALEARLEQTRAMAELSATQLERATKLRGTRAMAEEDYDRARWTHQSNTNQVLELLAQLATARLGGRTDAVVAADAELSAAAAALQKADWSVSQKAQSAPKPALVYDTLYREGEFIPAGIPVVSLLPPDNIKIRFFVPEAEFASFKGGDRVRVRWSGASGALECKVSYLSPRPEYTPPVLYNRENRAKLVFMIEALPVDPSQARDLHPGQPVDVLR